MGKWVHYKFQIMDIDFSKEIYNNYYNVKDRIVEITMKDNTVLEGTLVSFFHGDKDADEPFVTQWHFVNKKDIEQYQKNLHLSIDGNQDIGMNIKQKDIKTIRFKN